MEPEGKSDTNRNCHTRYSHQRTGTGTERFGNKRTSGDQTSYKQSAKVVVSKIILKELDKKIRKVPGNTKSRHHQTKRDDRKIKKRVPLKKKESA